MKKVKVGVVGCGTISRAYFTGMKRFPLLEVVACADIATASAESKAKEFDIPKVYEVDNLMKDPEIEIVVNLTIPAAHAPINLKILKANKHAYTEKPFGLNLKEALQVITEAKKRKLLVGSAPDTVLGGGTQTAKLLINDGYIGTPISATAFMAGHGPESWHPNPAFYYQKGGGPLLDMGPYYISSLINLLGPVKKVFGNAIIGNKDRLITSAPFYGQKIKVEVPTHVTGLLEFENGAICTLIMSFDVWKHSLPCIEIHGTKGSLQVPDPNTFGGSVKVAQGIDGGFRNREFSEIMLRYPYVENMRGLGVADMAFAIRNRRPHRANGAIALHCTEIMEGLIAASKSGKAVQMKHKCGKVATMPLGKAFGELD